MVMRRLTRRLGGLTVAAALGTAAVVVPAAQAEAARTPWHVSLHADSTTGRVGSKVHLTGKVSRAAAGKLVVLQEKAAPDRPWRNQRNAVVHRDGSYRTYDIPTANKVRRYRVVMPATHHRTRGVSPSVRVVVYQWQDLTSLDGINENGIQELPSVAIGGTSYPASLRAVTLVDPAGATSIEYNLDGKCLRFRGRFGLADASQAGGSASVSAEADGTPWFSGTFGLGESTPNAVTWATPPLKIHIGMTPLSYPDAEAYGAVATPEVLCTQ
jgi:hypothetical protein